MMILPVRRCRSVMRKLGGHGMLVAVASPGCTMKTRRLHRLPAGWRGAAPVCCLLLLAAVTACNSNEVAETQPPANPFEVHAIYNPNANAAAQIHAALAKAAREHKRVLLDFGGNWCGDCQILDFYFHQQPNAELIAQDYILVDVDVGQMDKNLEIAGKYGVPIQQHGVPALAVLDSSGNVVYSQGNGQFAAMGKVDPASVTRFLERWKE